MNWTTTPTGGGFMHSPSFYFASYNCIALLHISDKKHSQAHYGNLGSPGERGLVSHDFWMANLAQGYIAFTSNIFIYVCRREASGTLRRGHHYSLLCWSGH